MFVLIYVRIVQHWFVKSLELIRYLPHPPKNQPASLDADFRDIMHIHVLIKLNGNPPINDISIHEWIIHDPGRRRTSLTEKNINLLKRIISFTFLKMSVSSFRISRELSFTGIRFKTYLETLSHHKNSNCIWGWQLLLYTNTRCFATN